MDISENKNFIAPNTAGPSKALQFDGIFQGKESEIRITPDNMISVFDFIKVAGGQENPKQTWNNIQNIHENEVVQNLDYFQFKGQGQRKTPVISVQGMVKLLFWLPGEMAKKFRAKSAETMIRYLGGDLTLIDEIKKIDQEHTTNPNNIAQVFRSEVNQQNLLFNQDQINTSNKLIAYYGDKTNIFYMFSFLYLNEMYAKFGVVGEVREFHKRVQEHIAEFEDINFYNIMQCLNVTKVEADFKETALVSMNKAKIPKKNGGNHVEIIKLSEIVTLEVIKEEMIKVAGTRMVDPPPRYVEIQESNTMNLDIEKERTKQKEEETKQKEEETKQKEEETKQKEQETKQLQIQLEIKKLELGYYSIQQSKLSSINIVSEIQLREVIGENHDLYEELIEHFPKFIEKHLIKTKCEDDMVNVVCLKFDYKMHCLTIAGIAYSDDIINKMMDLYYTGPELIGYKLVYYPEDYPMLEKLGLKKRLTDLEVKRRRLRELENEA
jgi:hypothetical protein